jgi:hypothetical protein
VTTAGRWASRWVPRIAVVLFILAWVVLKIFKGFEADWFVALAGILLFALLELGISTRDAVQSLADEVREMQRAAPGALRSLLTCIQDLSAKIADVREHEVVRMDQLALDLANAWDYVVNLLITHPQLKHLEMRVLVITGDVNSLGRSVPYEVSSWCRRSEDSVRRIEEWFREKAPDLKASGRSISVELKRYAEIPVLHGLRVSAPFEARYLSFCRWNGGQYEWGEFAYRKTEGRFVDENLRDLARAFDGAFDHLWRSQGEARKFSASG